MTPAEDRHDEAATLSSELGDLLIELSIGVHRYAMYPPSHPSLVPVAGRIAGRLARCLDGRDRLDLGVARDQLVIEGVATDPGHPVLSDLARRLHAHQLGAVTFRAGVRGHEVEDLLAVLARDLDEDGEDPVGRLPPERIPGWDHIALHPIGYSDLRLDEDAEASGTATDRAAELWLGLARAAMAADEPYAPAAAPDSKVLAERIQRHRKEEAYDQVIAGYLLQLADELGRGDAGGETTRARVSNLVRELDERTLTRLLEMGGDEAGRQKFLRDVNRSFAADAVVKVLRAASEPSGRPISRSLSRLLTKLSRYAGEEDGDAAALADAAVRSNVEKLLAGWELEDPNPRGYDRLLDRVARDLRNPEDADRTGEEVADAAPAGDGVDRIVATAVEADAFGPAVERAVTRLLDAGEVERLLELVDGSESGAAGREILEFAFTPDQLRRLLSGGDLDSRTLDVMVEHLGSASVPPLLDALVESSARAVRRKVFDRLLRIDELPAAELVARLDDPRWYAVRNLLALIQRLEAPPPGFDAAPFLEHPDPRVRREALPLALDDPSTHDRAIAAGLAADDERLVRLALVELQDDLPEALVPTLVKRVVRSERPEPLRALAVRALAGTRSTLARDALLDVAGGSRTLLGRRRLAEPSVPVLAALEVLAAGWPDDPEVGPLLEAARESREPDVREAAAGASGAGR